VTDSPGLILESSIEIRCPPAEVFEVFVNDDNFFALHPNAIGHRDITPLEGGGHSCTQVYRLWRRTFAFENSTLEYVPGERFVGEAHRDRVLQDRETLLFVAVADGTEVRVHAEFFAGASTALARAVMRAVGKGRMAKVLKTLKQLAESGS
jgi:uncharacterized protein YndB with AHSA1/START domain